MLARASRLSLLSLLVPTSLLFVGVRAYYVPPSQHYGGSRMISRKTVIASPTPAFARHSAKKHSSTSLFHITSEDLREQSRKESANNIIKKKPIYYDRNDDRLKGFGLPRGLRDALIKNINGVSSKRIWIVDNSGSMNQLDGHLFNEGDTNSVDRTRWAEAKETVNVHAQLSSLLGAPTDIRLLNKPSKGGPQRFRVGYGNSRVGDPSMSIFRPSEPDSRRVQKYLGRSRPKGKTPLHEAVLEVRRDIVQQAHQLRADGMKVTIVICTDGTNNPASSDGVWDHYTELEEALDKLCGLPVNVVIRLCTDHGYDVDFYNNLDEKMDRETSFELDVLDDYEAEAKEVYEHNPWLNYALVLHRMREMGLQSSHRLLDSLDQRPFDYDEIRSFCVLLFGTESLPDPLCEMEDFKLAIEELQSREQMHWNPNKQAMTSWIDLDEI